MSYDPIPQDTGRLFAIAVAVAMLSTAVASAADRTLDTFKRQELTGVYFSEGANAGDMNHDGQTDIVYGPYWFAGPSFSEKREIYPAKPQNTEGYADNFFNWVHDFNGDGWSDVFVVGFPGTPAYVYENPQAAGHDAPWPKHQVFDWVSNESPHFTNLVGDERPELVCTRDGFFGYATVDWDKPFEAWTFHPISDRIAAERFGHGLGVGDINGDGRLDIINQHGWFEQPDSLDSPRWAFHEYTFAPAGGAEMYAYDVDGDGDSDVITSLAAHEFGLAWFEQVPDGDGVTFKKHLIMGKQPEENRYGVLFSELHSVGLADMDGDGLKDIVTGKTYWSHHRKSPLWDAGAVVYVFKLVRGENGVDWIPYKADGEAGIGRQISIVDVNGDKLPDIVVGGMKGAHALLHRRDAVDEATWQKAQPRPYAPPAGDAAKSRLIDPETGRAPGAIEGEALTLLDRSGGQSTVQDMAAFSGGEWSGGEQLYWRSAAPGDRLQLELPVDAVGDYQVEMALTKAPDYGVVRVLLDDQPLGEPIDLFHGNGVTTTGALKLGSRQLDAGKHRLTLEITGANPEAVKAYMVGLDFVRLNKK